jgi:hypothetical protein
LTTISQPGIAHSLAGLSLMQQICRVTRRNWPESALAGPLTAKLPCNWVLLDFGTRPLCCIVQALGAEVMLSLQKARLTGVI